MKLYKGFVVVLSFLLVANLLRVQRQSNIVKFQYRDNQSDSCTG
ncbi:MAG: hypothetical protein ACE5IR_13395 [bacterium]